MARGGARPGAGKKKGTLGPKAKATQEAIAAAKAKGELPLEYMLRTMRESQDPERRDRMAVAAAPYIHPKLANIEHTGKDGDAIKIDNELKVRFVGSADTKRV